MANVASEAGLSTGAIYTYVASKEALLHLVFAVGFGISRELQEIPIPTPPFDETLRLVKNGLRTSAATPRLSAAVDGLPVDARAELAEIIEERYTTLANVWPLLAVIERSAVDLPEMEALYFQRRRRRHQGELTTYIEQRVASGHFRRQVDATVAARVVTETIVWFAWHRREDRDADLYDDERALATVIDMLTNALIAPDR